MTIAYARHREAHRGTLLALFAFSVGFTLPFDLADRFGLELRGWASPAVMVPALAVATLAASCVFTWAMEGSRTVATMVRVREPRH